MTRKSTPPPLLIELLLDAMGCTDLSEDKKGLVFQVNKFIERLKASGFHVEATDHLFLVNVPQQKP